MQLHLPPVAAEIAALDARLLVLSFAPLDRLQAWLPRFRTEFVQARYRESGRAMPSDVFSRTRFLADPERAVYHAYGLGRNSVLRVYGPRIIWQYVRWALAGRPIARPTEDTLQRGGDFVVGCAGRLTLAHVGRDQSDRPPASALLAALGADGRAGAQGSTISAG